MGQTRAEGYSPSMPSGRRYGRRAAGARVAGLLAAVFVVLLLSSPSAAADGIQLKDLHHGREDRVGEPVDVVARVHGKGCAGTIVTFSFVGGPATDAAAVDTRHDDCDATATLQIPLPAECDGTQRDGRLTLQASIPDADPRQQDMTVRCPTVAPPPPPPPPPTPTASPTPTESAMPPPPPPTAGPTPPGSTPAPSSVLPPALPFPSSLSAPLTASQSPGAGTVPVPSSAQPSAPEAPEEQPLVARNAALLVPVDDGGPQPPDPGTGHLLADQMAALLALVSVAAGGALTALIWHRGASRSVVGGVVAGTLVLASAPLIAPSLTAQGVVASTAVRIRPIAVDQAVQAGATASATAQCPAGSVLVGGGVRSGGAGAAAGVLSLSVPTADGWTATATAPVTDDLTLTAVALCTTDTGLGTTSAASTAASLAEGDTGRTQARCADGAPLALGWSGERAPAVAELPLRNGATSIAWGTQDAATSLTNVLCTAPGSTAYPVRHDSEQVQIAAGTTGSAAAICGRESWAVGGGYVAAANVGGRVAPVTVLGAAPDGGVFHVEVAAAGTGTGVLLTAYALCVPVH